MANTNDGNTVEQVEEQEVETEGALVLNYTVIPIFFLLLGIVIGAVGHDRLVAANQAENEDLILRAVAAVAQAQGESGQAAAPQTPATPDPRERYSVSVEGDPFKGPEDAIVTIVEFSDFRCGYCKRFHEQTYDTIMENYEGQVRFVYRDFPFLSEASYVAALAAECAHDQGKFWEYHDELFVNQSTLSGDTFLQIAEDLDMDVDEFTSCMDNQTHQAEVVEDYNDAQELGVGGTPAFFINGRFISGAQSYQTFAALIDQEIAAANE